MLQRGSNHTTKDAPKESIPQFSKRRQEWILVFLITSKKQNHEHKCHIKTNLQFISQSIAKSFVLFNFHMLITLFHLSRVSFAPPYDHISRTWVKGENWFYDFWEPPVKGQDWFLRSFLRTSSQRVRIPTWTRSISPSTLSLKKHGEPPNIGR
jgi:hypothetical protein